jgi:hypothetical protein
MDVYPVADGCDHSPCDRYIQTCSGSRLTHIPGQSAELRESHTNESCDCGEDSYYEEHKTQTSEARIRPLLRRRPAQSTENPSDCSNGHEEDTDAERDRCRGSSVHRRAQNIVKQESYGEAQRPQREEKSSCAPELRVRHTGPSRDGPCLCHWVCARNSETTESRSRQWPGIMYGLSGHTAA